MDDDHAAAPRPAVHLRALSRDELASLAAGGRPDTLPPLVDASALPPAFVLARAWQHVAAGEPLAWWGPCLVLRADDGVAVGGAAFKGPPVAGRVEILYGVAWSCRGRGWGRGAVDALSTRAFRQGARQVLAEIAVDNEASARTARAAGFHLAGSRVAEDGVAVQQWLREGPAMR